MTDTPDVLTAGLLGELDAFDELLCSLDPEDLERPTRCEGWNVRDVAAHVVGTMADIAAGRLEGQGTPEVTARQVAERQDRSAGDLVGELRDALVAVRALLESFDDAAWEAPAPGGYDYPLAVGVEALWAEAWIHADDIRHALGRPSVVGPGLGTAAVHLGFLLERDGWGPARLSLGELAEITVNGEDDGEVTTVVTDPLQFVLAASGRRDPAELGLGANVNVFA